jgi:hypothetical protein
MLVQMTDAFRKHRDVLKRQLDLLERGEFGTGEQLPNAAVMEDTKFRLKSIIEEMEPLIVEYGPASS